MGMNMEQAPWRSARLSPCPLERCAPKGRAPAGCLDLPLGLGWSLPWPSPLRRQVDRQSLRSSCREVGEGRGARFVELAPARPCVASEAGAPSEHMAGYGCSGRGWGCGVAGPVAEPWFWLWAPGPGLAPPHLSGLPPTAVSSLRCSLFSSLPLIQLLPQQL